MVLVVVGSGDGRKEEERESRNPAAICILVKRTLYV